MLSKINKTTKSNFITFGIVIAAYIFMQILIVTDNASYLLIDLLVQFCYYIILAISLNLTVGILGELSLGHAGFFCVGAFASATFSKVTEHSISNDLLRFIIALLIGAIAAAIFGIIISLSVLRLSGDYLAIVTLAFGEIIKNVFNSFYFGIDSNGIHIAMEKAEALHMGADGKAIIQGAKGISSVPQDSTFTIGIILVLISLFIILNLINSRSGRAIMAVRDNRIAAQSLGININKYRVMAFSISASIAGIAGTLYAHNFSNLTASSKTFGYNMSIMILVFVVLGGIGKIRGSIIAAVVLTILPEYLRFLNDYRMLIYSVVLITMMIFNWSPKVIEWRKKHSLKGFLIRFNPKATKGEE